MSELEIREINNKLERIENQIREISYNTKPSNFNFWFVIYLIVFSSVLIMIGIANIVDIISVKKSEPFSQITAKNKL